MIKIFTTELCALIGKEILFQISIFCEITFFLHCLSTFVYLTFAFKRLMIQILESWFVIYPRRGSARYTNIFFYKGFAVSVFFLISYSSNFFSFGRKYNVRKHCFNISKVYFNQIVCQPLYIKATHQPEHQFLCTCSRISSFFKKNQWPDVAFTSDVFGVILEKKLTQ